MACRDLWEYLLKVLNFLLILVGLTMIGYGVYLFVEYRNAASTSDHAPISPSRGEFMQLGRPMLVAVSSADSILDKLPKAWFIYLFTGLGAVVLFIACCGCIGTATRNLCCLTCVFSNADLVDTGGAWIGCLYIFDKGWKEEIPTDKTGNFEMMYEFLEKHWKIIKWVALGVIIFEALVFLLALVVRGANRPADYDSDEEYIGGPRQQIRQPLINRAAVPASSAPVAGTLDHRPSRNDAWSTRMREKYGLDTSEFSYNPSEYQQAPMQAREETSRCIIM